MPSWAQGGGRYRFSPPPRVGLGQPVDLRRGAQAGQGVELPGLEKALADPLEHHRPLPLPGKEEAAELPGAVLKEIPPRLPRRQPGQLPRPHRLLLRQADHRHLGLAAPAPDPHLLQPLQAGLLLRRPLPPNRPLEVVAPEDGAVRLGGRGLPLLPQPPHTGPDRPQKLVHLDGL